MRIIVTDKLARRADNVARMIEIELPCCETTAHIEELADSVGCEACGVVLEFGAPIHEAIPVAA